MIGLFTVAVESVAAVTDVTGAVEAAFGVVARRVWAADASVAFVDV